MKQIVLKDSFVNKISRKQHKILLATIRIYAVIAMKYKVVLDTFTLKNLNNGEFIDLYSDLLATYQEGAKNYFRDYSNTVLEILNETGNEYVSKMQDFFQIKNDGVNTTYKILKQIRNGYSFHFKIDKLNPINGAPIGIIDDNRKVTFTSITPNLFGYISKELGTEMSQETIQNFYRTTLNEEVRPFIEYLEEIIHRIVDENVEYI